MDPSSIEKLEKNMRAMGGNPIGEDDENIIWQLPNGIRWPIPKVDKSLVLSPKQKVGVAPVPKQIIVREPSPIVERPLIPTMPEKAVPVERKEFLVREVEATSSHYANRMVPNKTMKRGGKPGKHKNGTCHSLSPGFIEEANKIFQEQGRAAAQEFIRRKRDLWSAK